MILDRFRRSSQETRGEVLVEEQSQREGSAIQFRKFSWCRSKSLNCLSGMGPMFARCLISLLLLVSIWLRFSKRTILVAPLGLGIQSIPHPVQTGEDPGRVAAA